MPADHGGRFDDLSITRPSRDRSKTPESMARMVRSVGVNLGRSILPLQHQDLMAKSEDFGVALVATHHQQPETSDQQPEQVG